jgi:hypothetical protein
LTAAGPGIENISPKSNSIDHNGDSRTKRKYTRGGHKKLKLVAPILEVYYINLQKQIIIFLNFFFMFSVVY